MAAEIASPDFDYSSVPATDARKCKKAYDHIVAYQRQMAADIVAIGEQLIFVKQTLDHGLFGKWIQHHFAWSDRTARRMMQAAEVFGKTDNLADLSVDQSALYLLSDESCPDDVREQVIGEATKGEVITHAKVKQAIDDFVNDQNEDEEKMPEPEPVEQPAEVVPIDDVLDWSLLAFLSDMHAQVDRWRSVCPQRAIREMAEALRDIASQLEEQTPEAT